MDFTRVDKEIQWLWIFDVDYQPITFKSDDERRIDIISLMRLISIFFLLWKYNWVFEIVQYQWSAIINWIRQSGNVALLIDLIQSC